LIGRLIEDWLEDWLKKIGWRLVGRLVEKDWLED